MRTLSAALALAAGLTAQNSPPATPTITEPEFSGQLVNPQDVHMETAPFSDSDPGDQHLETDWEIWTLLSPTRVWTAHGATGLEKVHAHFGDGVFEGPLAGATQLDPGQLYQLRVRHRDDSGDPATEWSPHAIRVFVTGNSATNFPLDIDDVVADPAPTWLGPNGPIELPTGSALRLENTLSQLLLRFEALVGPGNTVTNPPAIPGHLPVRLVFDSGNAGRVVIPESELTVTEHGCEATRILLPAIDVGPSQTLVFWVGSSGATYVGAVGQLVPDWRTPARNFMLPWVVRESGYSVDLVAENFQLPVNIAFVPNAGTAPGDPKFYVTELYGRVKTVTNDGTVLTYASNLLNFNPTGAFPGSGEQGVTGIAVDPVSGDVFVSLLREQSGFGTNHEPRILRFTSNDGGRTAASETTILYMPGEYQGQSHQISRLEIVAGELFCHMGDGFSASTARNLNSYRGKILRLQLNGAPVASNPFYNGAPFSARDYVYALGVRNPFGGAWREADGARYMVENGPSIDRFAKLVAGRDYLWAGANNDMTNFALYNWNPSSGPVNLAFVQNATFGGSGFPAGKQGHGFVSESGATYANGQQAIGKKITEWELDQNGNLLTGPTSFVEYIGDGRATMVGLAAGPDGLYFTELYRDDASNPTVAGARVIRVSFGDTRDCNSNGLSDACEIATGRVTDFDQNGVPDPCDMLSEDTDSITLSTGGSVQFTLNAGVEHAGRTYLLLGSSTGTTPGITLPAGVNLPLNGAGDGWFTLTLINPNSAILQSTLGTLDAAGSGAATLFLPLGTPPVLAGLQLHHAYAVYDPALGFIAASNAVPATLLP